jgi:hypothetical protein
VKDRSIQIFNFVDRKKGEPTMLSYTDFPVRQERYKELLQEAEQERLIRAAELRHPGNWRLHRKVADWVGDQMVSWGYKLQRYGATTSPCGPQVAGCQ